MSSSDGRTAYLVMDEQPDIPVPLAVFESACDAAVFATQLTADGNIWVRVLEVMYRAVARNVARRV